MRQAVYFDHVKCYYSSCYCCIIQQKCSATLIRVSQCQIYVQELCFCYQQTKFHVHTRVCNTSQVAPQAESVRQVVVGGNNHVSVATHKEYCLSCHAFLITIHVYLDFAKLSAAYVRVYLYECVCCHTSCYFVEAGVMSPNVQSMHRTMFTHHEARKLCSLYFLLHYGQ